MLETFVSPSATSRGHVFPHLSSIPQILGVGWVRGTITSRYTLKSFCLPIDRQDDILCGDNLTYLRYVLANDLSDQWQHAEFDPRAIFLGLKNAPNSRSATKLVG